MLTEDKEGVDFRRYLASHGEQESPEEIHGHQIREAEREIWAAVPRSRLDSEEDDKGRQAGLYGRTGKSSRTGQPGFGRVFSGFGI